MKYSFIMPAYKASFIREAIDSILGQTYYDFELIVVDDASPEGLESIVSNYHDPRLVYYKNKQNIGRDNLVAQWNHSISYAQGDIIILASDDDVYDNVFLENIDYLVRSYPDINVFKTLIRKIDGTGKVTGVEEASLPEKCGYKEYFEAFCLGKMPSGIPQFAFRKEELLYKGGFVNFPCAWFSDDATVAKLACNGIAIYNQDCFSFRNSGYNITSKRNSYKLLKSKIKASVEFYGFILSNFDIDFITEINDILVEKIRRVTNIELQRAGNITFICAIVYSYVLSATLYPARWISRHLISRFYHQMIK